MMKNKIKKILKEELTSIPQYKRGEVTIFTSLYDRISYETVDTIAKKLGYELIGQPHNNGYLIKTNPGDEEQAGSHFVENYPEFFEGWEREGYRAQYFRGIVSEIEEDLEELSEYFDYIDRRRFINDKEFNGKVDLIIDKLNNIKI